MMNSEMKNSDVVIWAVGNGYRVNPTRYMIATDTISPKAEERVFESFDGMVAYLRTLLPVYPATFGTITTTAPKRR